MWPKLLGVQSWSMIWLPFLGWVLKSTLPWGMLPRNDRPRLPSQCIHLSWVTRDTTCRLIQSGVRTASSLQSKMTERIPWWKAFLPKKKSGGPKDTPHSLDQDFDPFAQQPEKQKDAAASKPAGDNLQGSNKGSSLLSDDTYDDSHLESVFNEQTCRRNMNVSRSGRFKEKRRVRSSLPIQDNET
ncbi:hypothetical protein F7725_024927 [Dissostichus mawsoni]|uniref:Uncharacterized protein n=1 Tax=Dissostichus mawsoni TaxID=36200 RepID=A0A7J5XA70_DISMA|nr:hypothetical protein F7725_024927 [Dissostichus mawsoni]